jgi:hypothetical protein
MMRNNFHVENIDHTKAANTSIKRVIDSKIRPNIFLKKPNNVYFIKTTLI